jgi:transcriptional regulator with XRE-family HTH domain
MRVMKAGVPRPVAARLKALREAAGWTREELATTASIPVYLVSGLQRGDVYALTPLAAAAALKGNDAWAARILGTRDAVIERIGTTSIDRSVLELRASTERGVRERLAADRWVRAHAAGRSASIDALLADIDRPRAPHPVD